MRLAHDADGFQENLQRRRRGKENSHAIGRDTERWLLIPQVGLRHRLLTQINLLVLRRLFKVQNDWFNFAFMVAAVWLQPNYI